MTTNLHELLDVFVALLQMIPSLPPSSDIRTRVDNNVEERVQELNIWPGHGKPRKAKIAKKEPRTNRRLALTDAVVRRTGCGSGLRRTTVR